MILMQSLTNGGKLQRNNLLKSWIKIWTSIKLMRGRIGTSWKCIQKTFQILYMEIQQAQRHRAKMKRMKQGLIGWLKSLGANLGTTNNQGRRLGRRRTTNSSKKKQMETIPSIDAKQS